MGHNAGLPHGNPTQTSERRSAVSVADEVVIGLMIIQIILMIYLR